MTKPLLDALDLEPLDHPPIWVMRQAGRYLPEYRRVRERYSFQEAVTKPELAAEITLQPIRRFGMDGAIIFADIMTPLEAMGVEMTFDPGPRLEPLSIRQVAQLRRLDPDAVAHVADTTRLVAAEVPAHTAVIGFAGAPITLLAYLLEGGGSKDFMAMRAALSSAPDLAEAALENLAASMRLYLRAQVTAGAEVVQLFDTWAGVLDADTYRRFAVPAARASLSGLEVPTIYFAPGAGHTLGFQGEVGARAYGVDWRTPIDHAFTAFEGRAVQGNLDPAILLSDPATVRARTLGLLEHVAGRPGHILNLGHGIDHRTPPENVSALVEAARH